MRLETAIKRLRTIYESAKKNEEIMDPVAYALYYTWRYAEETRAKEARKNGSKT